MALDFGLAAPASAPQQERQQGLPQSPPRLQGAPRGLVRSFRDSPCSPGHPPPDPQQHCSQGLAAVSARFAVCVQNTDSGAAPSHCVRTCWAGPTIPMLTEDDAVWPDEDLCGQGLETWGLWGSAWPHSGAGLGHRAPGPAELPWGAQRRRPPALRLSPAGLQALRGGVW